MRTFLLLLAICFTAILFSPTVHAQEWGEISEAEWQMGPPMDFPEAGAVIIFDDGLAVTELSGLEFTRHMRVKVFDNEGLEKVKNVVIEYYHYDKLRNVKAHILHPDGTVIEIGEDAITTLEKGDLRETGFSFAMAGPGDIFEYTYRVDYYGGYDKLGAEKFFLFSQERRYSQYKDRQDYGTSDLDSHMDRFVSNLPNWYFDHPVYCLLSRYTAKLGADLDYSYFTTKLPPDKIEPIMERVMVLTATAYKKHIWTMENLPPYVPDPTAQYDDETQRCGLYFQLFSTVGENRAIGGVYSDEHWKYIGESIQGYIDEYVKKSKSIKKLAKSLAAGPANTRGKVEAIYNYISKEFQIDSTGYVMRPRNSSMKKLFNDKIGMSFELNLLLVEMLKEAGLQAWPILITTRNKISFRKSGTFNHMLALADVGGAQILLDASAKGCPAGSLLPICMPSEGVLVDYSDSRPISLAADECDQSGSNR